MFVFFLALVFTAIPTGLSAPAAPNDADQLQQLKNDGQLELLQRQLRRLQAELQTIKGDNDKIGSQTNGVFYDKPVVPQARVQQRQIGWQPLRRGLNDKPDTDSSPKFQLSLNDNESLKSQLLQAVERHLLDDLATAQRYGIEPRQILEDLRQRNRNSGITRSTLLQIICSLILVGILDIRQ